MPEYFSMDDTFKELRRVHFAKPFDRAHSRHNINHVHCLIIPAFDPLTVANLLVAQLSDWRRLSLKKGDPSGFRAEAPRVGAPPEPPHDDDTRRRAWILVQPCTLRFGRSLLLSFRLWTRAPLLVLSFVCSRVLSRASVRASGRFFCLFVCDLSKSLPSTELPTRVPPVAVLVSAVSCVWRAERFLLSQLLLPVGFRLCDARPPTN